ncbi:MAG: hypothetical protein WDN48_18160 [Pseudolabrys sp.]
MSEGAYRTVTHDMPLTTAQVLARINPGMTLIYVSASGADPTEKGQNDVGARQRRDRKCFGAPAVENLRVPSGPSCSR